MIKKRIAIFFVVVACFIVQNTMLKSIDFGAVSPNLLLIITAGFGFAGGRKEGMYVGFILGLLVDLYFGYYDVLTDKIIASLCFIGFLEPLFCVFQMAKIVR